MPPRTILIIDGNSLLHRAFHAIPPLSTTKGLPTNAVYGFTNMLFKVLSDQKPNYVAVALDKSKITFRHNQYESYKANRKPTPDELRSQFPLLKELLHAMRIPVFETEGYEADDLIGTITSAAEKEGLECIILTGDQDALQLITPQTRVLITKKGISELEIYDRKRVVDKYKVTPEQFADFKGLMGDPSDNIPGVPGIGKKTASKLLEQFGSVEEILKRVEETTPRLQKIIVENSEKALMSKQLATIIRNAPIELNIENCRWKGPEHSELIQVFKKLEFKSLLKYLQDPKKQTKGDSRLKLPQTETSKIPYRIVTGKEKLKDLAAAANQVGRVALAFEGDKNTGIKAVALAMKTGKGSCLDSKTTNCSGSFDWQVFYLKLDKVSNCPDVTLKCLKNICENSETEKIIHNGKEAILILNKHGFKLKNLAFDTMLAVYLINPASSNQDLESVAIEHLNMAIPSSGKDSLAARAGITLELAEILQTKLKEQNQDRLFYKVEIPLIYVLADMEITGVAVDKKHLKTMSRELQKQMENLQDEIYSLAGEKFNINSTKQLGYILFEKLQLPVIKKTKTGYSTDAEVLEKLAGKHDIIPKILTYRHLMKLKSTYLDGIMELINPKTGRLHTTFHQTVTATGRLSSSEPNLQNIPIRLEQGRRIRKAFVPAGKDKLILAADYSQVELRILAHFSGDPNLIEAFAKRQDIHTRTAAEVFGVTMEEVTPELRTRAKAVNFGIVYGISDFGLARDIGVSRKEARQYIENYFRRYAGVKKYIDQTIRKAHENGYVTTLLNRRRYLPELLSPNRTVRNFGMRTAINTPIQGSAADIIKLAMVQIHRELASGSYKSAMILQVHDELIFEVPRDEVDEICELVKNKMENAVILDVPLVVDLKLGPNWYDVQKYDPC